jgi:hypothetical protein
MPDHECAEVFAETADRNGLSNAVVDKDFWVCLQVKGYGLVSRCVTYKGTPGKLATGATAFMVCIGGNVMAPLSMPAGQEKQGRDRRSHVTSR